MDLILDPGAQPAASDADVLLLPPLDPPLRLHVPLSRHAALGAADRRNPPPRAGDQRIVRGIVLKGNGLVEIAPQLWPIALFLLCSLGLGLLRYRRTLD